MGTTQKGPDILGVCEVENQSVLEILLRHKRLRKENYQIIHKDAPDKRGIDVALVYKPTSFIVDSLFAITTYPLLSACKKLKPIPSFNLGAIKILFESS